MLSECRSYNETVIAINGSWVMGHGSCKISLHNIHSCSLSLSLSKFTNRNEAHGIFANKDLFAVNESVQREALKNFYEQRARVKVPKAIKFVTELDNCQVEKKKLRNAKLIGRLANQLEWG